MATCAVCNQRPARYSSSGPECQSCYGRRRRQENPDAAERDRAASRAWKARNKDRRRAYGRNYHQSRKATCPACSGPKEPKADMCRACRLENAEKRRDAIVEMYKAGVPIKEMAEVIGTTLNALGVQLVRLRKAGLIGRRYRQLSGVK